jgi:gamma-hexachlorocyclohexane dehydrochlorinase
MNSTEERLDRLESRVEIAALVAGYCEGVDRRDGAKFDGLWHPDADYLIGAGRGDFHGLAEIRGFPAVCARAWTQTHHWTTNHVIDFESADRATGRSDCIAVCEEHGGGADLISATYLDRYERRAGQWKFTYREVVRWFQSSSLDITLLPPGAGPQ